MRRIVCGVVAAAAAALLRCRSVASAAPRDDLADRWRTWRPPRGLGNASVGSGWVAGAPQPSKCAAKTSTRSGVIWTSGSPASVLASGDPEARTVRVVQPRVPDPQIAQLADAHAAAAERLGDRAAAGEGWPWPARPSRGVIAHQSTWRARARRRSPWPQASVSSTATRAGPVPGAVGAHPDRVPLALGAEEARRARPSLGTSSSRLGHTHSALPGLGCDHEPILEASSRIAANVSISLRIDADLSGVAGARGGPAGPRRRRGPHELVGLLKPGPCPLQSRGRSRRCGSVPKNGSR